MEEELEEEVFKEEEGGRVSRTSGGAVYVRSAARCISFLLPILPAFTDSTSSTTRTSSSLTALDELEEDALGSLRNVSSKILSETLSAAARLSELMGSEVCENLVDEEDEDEDEDEDEEE